MNIITISREFGSGGREVGKRLAELLGYDYYDKEIISIIAERHGLDEKYVESTLSSSQWSNVALSFRHSFSSPIYFHEPKVELLLEQKKVIDEIAASNRNCVIVGRNADVLLALIWHQKLKGARNVQRKTSISPIERLKRIF